MISDLARTAENLDSALTRCEHAARGSRLSRYAVAQARQLLADVVVATERRLAALDPPATHWSRGGSAPADHAPTVPAPGAREAGR